MGCRKPSSGSKLRLSPRYPRGEHGLKCPLPRGLSPLPPPRVPSEDTLVSSISTALPLHRAAFLLLLHRAGVVLGCGRAGPAPLGLLTVLGGGCGGELLSPPPGSGCTRASALWPQVATACLSFPRAVSGGKRKTWLPTSGRGGHKGSEAHFLLCGYRTGKFRFGQNQGWPRAKAPPLPEGEAGVRDPLLPGRSAPECGAKGSTGQARVTAGHRAGLHVGVDPPHLSAPPPGWDRRLPARARGPFVMHMRAPRRRKGPLQTRSRR